jgi:phage FluMu protein Com
MPQTLKCTECGAVMKTAADVPVGKRVKCPKCGQAFTVAAEGEANPFALGNGPAGAAAPAPSSGEAAGAGVGGGEAPPPKKGKGMLIGLIAGGVLLLCCCCPGGIGGGWWGYSTFLSGPNLQGGWIGKDNQAESMVLMSGGRAFVPVLGVVPKQEELSSGNATWKVDGKNLEITMNDTKHKIPWADSDRAKFTFELKDTTLTLTNTKNSAKTVFKKGDDKK